LNEFYNVTTKKYESGVCGNCTEKYCALNTYYEDLKADTGEGIVCMDIVDAVSIVYNNTSVPKPQCSHSAIAWITKVVNDAILDRYYNTTVKYKL
jgi:hypothetical protein